MKYKQVFFIWLLADAFLAAGLLCFAVYELVADGASNDDLWMALWAAGLGICFSLPSLLVILLFHFVFTKNAKHTDEYRMPYIALIICINMLYLLISQYWFGMTEEFNVFYIGTTLAGFLAFYIVDRKFRKKAALGKKQTDLV